MTRDISEFSGTPWRDIADQIPQRARAVPTMLKAEEQALYFWIARDWAKGAGAIVDLGCFAGGSTARLAAGAEAAGYAAEIHAYDRFSANEKTKENTLYPQGVAPFEGEDIRPLAERLLAPWADMIALYPGDLLQSRWHGGPIEVLAVDAAKSARAADRIADRFFPALIPAGSLIVQQDFLHRRQPWLIAQMHLLAGAAVPVAFCAHDCVAFLVTEQIDRDRLAAARVEHLDDDALIGILTDAAESPALAPVADRIAGAIHAVRANPGERRAWAFGRA